ncbi:cyclic peptide export ABC transporter [Pseudoalteromonas obscura]|uniref:Cyclic peptide export ABC transporter n=1 Tax=Pseudoalteromonas obscura TaxID=3048491 RepID=A0ABT7EH14_9GAMM|nr:cyclic peptide export ABC transporter [Pseudoalteromonas sp. P94(2023)]MDK2594342.1 cyclic peptide export ABC transporter [Pseudoalteromonas sp. P94(2023)]
MPRQNKIEEINKGLFHFLIMQGENRVLLSIITGVLGGLAYAALIPLILASISVESALMANFLAEEKVFVLGYEIIQPKFAIAFLLVCLAALILRAVSQILLEGVVVKAASGLRVYMSDRLYKLPIQELEQIGPSRFISAITMDVPTIAGSAASLPNFVINISVVLGVLGYIAFLDVHMLWTVLLVILFGVLSYRIPMMFGQKFYAKSRDSYDDIQESVRGFIYGAKELKLKHKRYQEYRDQRLITAEGHYVKMQLWGGRIFYMAIQYGNLVGFLAIGVIVYAAGNYYSLSNSTLVSVVVATLYLIGPLANIMNSIMPYSQGVVALKKLNTLINDMPQEPVSESYEPLLCDRIDIKELCYQYPGQEGFNLGPVSFTLQRGQITFAIGGNGSGKSTLAKLISNHYAPSEGEIAFNDTQITPENRWQARESISAIYTDFFLFTKLYGFAQDDLGKVESYLKKLALHDKVSLQGDMFSTISLSDGQRKRLALLVSYLEDRSLYVFDEWAADQDPEFKKVFYTELLPELKARGKIVFVVGHDELYFSQADQLLTMQRGRLVDIQSNQSCKRELSHAI